jgi:hypothetical protein
MCETAHKKKGYHLIEHDTVQSLPLYYFFFGLRLLARFTPRISMGSLQNCDMGSFKGHGSATAA